MSASAPQGQGLEQLVPLVFTILVTALVFMRGTEGSHLVLEEVPDEASYLYWDELEEQDTGLTCWTCPNKTDNEACNNWAPDKLCHTNHTVCRTVHRLDMYTGRSLNVLKQCTHMDDCRLEHVGCFDTDLPGIQDCVSCCDFSYCNEAVPSNISSAFRLSTVTNMAASQSSSCYNYFLLLLCSGLTIVCTVGGDLLSFGRKVHGIKA